MVALPLTIKSQDRFNLLISQDSANLTLSNFQQFNNKYYVTTVYPNVDLETESSIIEVDPTKEKVSKVIILDSLNFGRDPTFSFNDTAFYIVGKDRSLAKDIRYYSLDTNLTIIRKFRVNSTGKLNYPGTSVVLFSDGYIISQIDSLNFRYALMTKINPKGDILWKRYYFKNDIYSFIMKIDEYINHTIIFSSGTTKPEFSQRRAQLTQIDTSGNILWEYIPDEPMSGGAVPPWFAVLSDSTIVMNYSIDKDWDDPEDWNVKLYKFVWIDREGQFIKERYIPHHYRVDAYIADVKAGKHGDYFFTFGRENDIRDNYQSQAVLTKYNNAGDTLWHRSYSHPDFPNEDFQYSLVEMEEREDRSLVLLVEILTSNDYDKAWLFTVDSNGCFYTDFCGERLVSAPAVELPEQENTATLFPNPADDQVTIQSSMPFDQVVLYDLSGHKIFERELRQTGRFTIQTYDLLPGIYVIHLNHKGKILERLKFVKI
jgi:hypothetical protein